MPGKFYEYPFFLKAQIKVQLNLFAQVQLRCNSGPSDLSLPFILSQIGNQAMKLHLGNPSEQHPNSEGWIIFVALLASQNDSKENTR